MAHPQTVSEFLQTPAIREQLQEQLDRIIQQSAQAGISYSGEEAVGAPSFGCKPPSGLTHQH